MEKEQVCLDFPVTSFDEVENPYIESGKGDAGIKSYIAICDIKDVPEGIPMSTNPRNQNISSAVPQEIRASLLNEDAGEFLFLNRGIVVSADDAKYDDRNGMLRLTFSNLSVHGDIDGGHTYKIILANRDGLGRGKQYVRIEILTGVDGIYKELAIARNTFTAVKEMSLAESKHRFDIIKKAVKGLPVEHDIRYKENAEGSIDIADVINYLSMFNLSVFPNNPSACPSKVYGAKKRCLDDYLKFQEVYGDGDANPFVKMTPIISDLLALYDFMEERMPSFYEAHKGAGKYRNVKGVVVSKKGTEHASRFFHHPLDYVTPDGFLYPILGAFRGMLEGKDGKYIWMGDPKALAERIGSELAMAVVDRSRTLGNHPASVGRDAGTWKSLYITVQVALFKTMIEQRKHSC